jgi:hypothetical protein
MAQAYLFLLSSVAAVNGDTVKRHVLVRVQFGAHPRVSLERRRAA